LCHVSESYAFVLLLVNLRSIPKPLSCAIVFTLTYFVIFNGFYLLGRYTLGPFIYPRTVSLRAECYKRLRMSSPCCVRRASTKGNPPFIAERVITSF
jgi:hypothetical protein